MAIAPHVIGCLLTQHTRARTAFDDVSSTVHEALAGGTMGGYASAAAAIIAPASGVIMAADAMMGALAPFDAVRDR